MKRGIRLGGLPAHAMWSHFPLGGMVAANVWDLLSLSPWAAVSNWNQFAFWSLAVAMVAAVPTSLLGLLDYVALPEKKAPLAAAHIHAGMMGIALTLYAISLGYPPGGRDCGGPNSTAHQRHRSGRGRFPLFGGWRTLGRQVGFCSWNRCYNGPNPVQAPQGTPFMSLSQLAHTKRQIVAYIKGNGSATRNQLAHTLTLSGEAIRRHLGELKHEGWIQSQRIKTKAAQPGRPAVNYVLTAAGEHLFPKHYDDFSIALLETIQDSLGPDAAKQVLAAFTEKTHRSIPGTPGRPVHGRKTRAVESPLLRGGPLRSNRKRGSGLPLNRNQLSFLKYRHETTRHLQQLGPFSSQNPGGKGDPPRAISERQGPLCLSHSNTTGL